MRSWEEVNRSSGTRAELEKESMELRKKIEAERKIWERRPPNAMRDSTALSVFGLVLAVICIAMDIKDEHGILANIQLAAFIVRAIEKK